ncbi:hypothetical protein F5882DRAFT_114365 [Hyaloscypha sp. PMI_1271]|nr:hypothetical protein F5882DRAFT_114365 [Hyaloscypha sp. PMI_1271]
MGNMVWEIMWTEESMIHNHMLSILSILIRLIVWENIVSLFIYVVPSAVFEVVVADREGDRFVKDTVRTGLLSIIQVFICFNGLVACVTTTSAASGPCSGSSTEGGDTLASGEERSLSMSQQCGVSFFHPPGRWHPSYHCRPRHGLWRGFTDG